MYQWFHHHGRLVFSSPEKGVTLLNYTIEMETKIPFADGVYHLF